MESKRGRGRPIDPRTDAAILGAAMQLIQRDGFQKVTIPAVAEAAGVAKTTIYRRYPTPTDLTIAAINQLNVAFPPPDTGSAKQDVTILLDLARQRFDLSVTGALLVEEREHPDLWEAGQRQLFAPGIGRFRIALQRGVDRGELRPDLDVGLAAHGLLGSFFAHYFELGRPAEDWAQRVVEQQWPALVAPVGK